MNELLHFDAVLKELNSLVNMAFPNFEFELAICGGAVRDYVCGKAEYIKDYDVLLYITHKEYEEGVVEETINHKLVTDYLKNKLGQDKYQDYMTKLITYKNSSELQALSCTKDACFDSWKLLVQKYLVDFLKDKKFSIKNEFNQNSEDYFGGKFVGLVKIEDILGKPVDLIIVDRKIEVFMDKHFDFNLCKVCYYGNNKFHYNQDFLTDFNNKQLTLNPKGFIREQVEYALNTHYPRIKYKYEDYKLNCIKYPHLSNYQGLSDYIDRIVLAQNLEKTKIQNKSIKI